MTKLSHLTHSPGEGIPGSGPRGRKNGENDIGAEAEPKMIQKLIQRFVMFQFSSLMSSCI